MLQALGYRFLNAEGRQIAGGIGELDRIVRIDTSLAMPELKECSFRIACDVKIRFAVKTVRYMYMARRRESGRKKERFWMRR